ncbi:MAG: hypothetical protein RL264_2163 [Bacteroidota bacterium]|jgi:hypothetical protein
MKNLLFILLVVFPLLYSCRDGYGNSVKKGKLTVYFDKKSKLKTAEKFCLFWHDAGFIGKEKQNIRLLFAKNTIKVQLIASDPTLKKESLSFEEIKNFIRLQEMLDSAVFHPKHCIIEICDGDFNPLFIAE